jgi:hypothetical protein
MLKQSLDKREKSLECSVSLRLQSMKLGPEYGSAIQAVCRGYACCLELDSTFYGTCDHANLDLFLSEVSKAVNELYDQQLQNQILCVEEEIQLTTTVNSFLEWCEQMKKK